MGDSATPALIVGLRNPGEQYEATRHNLGADVVATLAARHDAKFKRAPRIRAEMAVVAIGDTRAILARPNTYMNESGQAVAPLVDYFGMPLDRLLIVHDDIDLPFAKLRVQEGGGSGGNNGVASTIRSLGNEEFWRLKCGVGRPPGRQEPASFVLKRFGKNERDDIDLLRQYGADVIELFVTAGGDEARQQAGEVKIG
ncbi:MAG: aminoacyl-tRNA hydrolase [Acidimicrobiia bacterium]|nr:aminoacyl-tRNA hydrolase [Acidimicrobiia bacterium]